MKLRHFLSALLLAAAGSLPPAVAAAPGQGEAPLPSGPPSVPTTSAAATAPPMLLASADGIIATDLAAAAPVQTAPEPGDRNAGMLLGGLVLTLAIARRRRSWIVLPIGAGPRQSRHGAERAHGPNGLSIPHGQVLPER